VGCYYAGADYWLNIEGGAAMVVAVVLTFKLVWKSEVGFADYYWFGGNS
jgi:hypothetical protein